MLHHIVTGADKLATARPQKGTPTTEWEKEHEYFSDEEGHKPRLTIPRSADSDSLVYYELQCDKCHHPMMPNIPSDMSSIITPLEGGDIDANYAGIRLRITARCPKCETLHGWRLAFVTPLPPISKKS